MKNSKKLIMIGIKNKPQWEGGGMGFLDEFNEIPGNFFFSIQTLFYLGFAMSISSLSWSRNWIEGESGFFFLRAPPESIKEIRTDQIFCTRLSWYLSPLSPVAAFMVCRNLLLVAPGRRYRLPF